MASVEDDLENFLDGCVDDLAPLTKPDRGAKSAPSTSAEPAVAPSQTQVSDNNLAFDPLAPPKKSGGKGGSKKTKKKAKAAAAFSPEDPLMAGAEGDLLEHLSNNLAQMLRDLPETDDSPKEELQATLAALAQQTREIAGGGGSGERAEESEDRIFKQILEKMEQMGQGPDMDGMMESIMQQLLSKEVLYQPLQEIGEQYPDWLEANKEKITADELTNYRRQHELIQELCTVYDSDEPNNFQSVVDLLQKMQECGQPPEDLIKQLAPNVAFASNGTPLFPGMPDAEGLPPELSKCTIT